MTAFINIAAVRDLRGVLLTPLMDSQKMAGDLRLRQRALLWPFIAAFVVAFIAGAIVFLNIAYTRGTVALYGYPDGNAGNMYRTAESTMLHLTPPVDKMAYSGLILGLVATAIMLRFRSMLPGFPLHPLAYALAPTWAMIVLWAPCFVAWLIKVPVMRYGGIKLYRRIRPFMLGMILGEFFMAMLWAVLSSPGIKMSVPEFPWP
jgi:MFS superfamily sulfate permease-like transporter